MDVAARQLRVHVDIVEDQSEHISRTSVHSRKGVAQILLQIDSENETVIGVVPPIQADALDILIVCTNGFAERLVHLSQTGHWLFRPEFASKLELETEGTIL